MYPFQRPFSCLISVFFFLALLFSLNAHANSCNTGIPPQQDASQQIYTGAPDASGGDVSLWGAGSGLGGFDSYANYGDYVMYAGLDFGAGKSTMELNVATGNTYNQTLELWVDGLPGQGQKIGQVIVQPTGSWGNYVTYTGTVNVCGVHDLYLIPVTDPWWEGLGNLMWFRFSGSTNPPAEEYSLTVQNGSGDGDYQAGAQITVNADPAPAGQTFSAWTGDTANLADANAASTTLTMPASAVSISATYANTPLGSCTPSGHTAQQSAFDQTYTGAPDASGGDVSLWGAGSGMGGFDDYNTYGDYVMYAGLDFGNGASSMELNIANGNNYNQTLELWIDGLPGQGQKIGELSVPPTGGWGTYVTYTGNVDVCSVHDLYLIPVTTHWEALGNLMWFRFIPGTTNPQNHTLTVNSGSGDGSYPSGTSVNISADAAPAGQQFAQWTGDTGGIADIYSTSTTLTMPAAATTVTATYEDVPVGQYNLTVHSGSGDGSYVEGANVAISADAAPAGQQFAQWTGDTGGIADVNAANTTLTMPAAATTVTATYENVPVGQYSLTVNNGIGGGSYAAGQTVAINANMPPAGQAFDQWTGDVAYAANPNAANTTVTMPASNISLTASYVQAQYNLTVNNGTGDGSYAQGAVVSITADAAPTGQHFKAWTGDIGGIADVNAASTTLTMPASTTSIMATYELDTPSNCVETGQTPQLSAFDQQYTGAPDAASSEVSLWGPGSGMGNFDDHYLYGDWVMYAGVDFSTGANEVTVHAAVDSSAPQILEFWVDGLPNGGGTKIGEATINSTGSWSTYANHTGVVDVCSVHDLYLIGRSNDPYAGIGNLIWFSFKNTLSNLSPTASLSATPTSGQAPLVVEFDASASTDPEGLNLAARWDFDYDGANFEMQQDNGPLYLNTQAVFFKPGTHTAAVEIRDPGDATSIDTITIQVDGVDAGDKQTVLVGQSAIMQGLVSPSSSVTWGTVSGPGAANFANPNDLNTSVSFPAGKGHYVLKMTAHGLGDSDTVQVEVVDEQPVIPIARRVDWSRAGVEGGIPDNIPVRIQLTAQDLASDPVNAIQNAIDSAAAPGVVLLPEGTYQLSSSSNQQVIRMRDGIVLRGRGMDKTQLVFHAPNLHYQGAINIYGSIGGVEYAVNAGYVEGSQRLQMANVGNLAVGDTIWLYQDNDPVLMSTERSDSGVGWNADWAQKSMSQLGRIASLSGNTIELDAPLRRSYSSTKNPRLVRVNTIKNVGIEDLAIHRQQDGANGFNVAIASAENSWIRNVEFAYAKRAHVWMSTSRFITLESNYGHDVLALGSGGNGYGFVTGKATSDTLIWNNILQRQGTALMVKEGSNGVVVAYNYVLDRHNATQGTTDVSLHGHYPYANLVEGNHIDASRTTDWWGPGGNYITYFRNRVRAAEGHPGTRGISVGDRTHYVNIVGNTFLNGVSGVSIEDDDLHRCHFTLLEGNLFNNVIEWNDLPASTISASRFLQQAPHFWGSTPWPVVGADVDSAGATPIPAEAWHQRILANGSAVPFD